MNAMTYKRTLPMVLMLVIGGLLILDFFISAGPLQTSATFLTEAGVIVSAFALGLGTINLLWVHSRKVRRRAKGEWMHSVILIVGFLVVFASGLIGGTNDPTFTFFFNNVISVAGTSIYGVLAFFTITAYYRALKARTLPSTVMLVVAIIIYLGMTPVGEAISPLIVVAMTWINNVPNVAGGRVILLGTAVASIVLILKTLAGIERGYLGEGGE